MSTLVSNTVQCIGQNEATAASWVAYGETIMVTSSARLQPPCSGCFKRTHTYLN
ncbi:hypothetical protein DPMN_131115 [Dreissena polymorpha]|uniref:Uncharacterized protein n=1 Tax=Dreissena polymorpha TaxID=45954 RepID=A0A9D4HC98_DREPO|nr:hypothetical protein DPMN_131115 [Dreissena polymorpha]